MTKLTWAVEHGGFGSCPYYRQEGTKVCNQGCWEEPRCVTDEPEETWGSHLVCSYRRPRPVRQ